MAVEHRFADAVVTDRAVFFDGYELPWHIAEGGISFTPGGFAEGIDILTIEFLVENTAFLGTKPDSPWLVVGDEWFWLENLIEVEYLTTILAFHKIDKEYGIGG